MKLKTLKFGILLGTLFTSSLQVSLAARPTFDKSKDILIAQFDSKPDPDDIHSIAALGCMLAHNDFKGVRRYGVAGAFGKQGGAYINAPNLFNMVFGEKNRRWTDARNDRAQSIIRVRNRTRRVLRNGGRVWVQEAGQSDFTRDWLQALLDDGIPARAIKNRVTVVQHSLWNEEMTTAADLRWVRNNTNYRKIDDGNGSNKTPAYRSTDKSFLRNAKASRNTTARALWREADRVIQAHGHFPGHSSISTGGVDFSDCVENWYIFKVYKKANNTSKFWSRYVTNNP